VIASAALLQWLPPLLFALWAGALSDRLDRRLLVVSADVLRLALVAMIALTIVTDSLSPALVLVTLFLVATAEVFADNTTTTLLPMVVARDDLAIANSRVMFGFVTVNQLVGPSVGAALFTAGRAWPFLAEVVLVALSALLILRLHLPEHRRDPEVRRAIRHDIAEGFRWAVHHPPVRTLILTIFTFNITFGAAWSVLVLYATRHLGLGAIGFGLVTTVQAIGGLLGTVGYGRLITVVSLGNIMRVGLVIEALTHLGLALATSPWVAMPIFFVFGAHAAIWGTTSLTIRQRAVPIGLQGRVNSVNTVGVFGGLVIGSAIGGLLAKHFGITAPFWFAFVGTTLAVVLIWRQLVHIAHDEPVGPAS
jgi:MFS family permease